MYGAKFNLVPIIKTIDTTNTYDAELAGEFEPDAKIFKFLNKFDFE